MLNNNTVDKIPTKLKFHSFDVLDKSHIDQEKIYKVKGEIAKNAWNVENILIVVSVSC